MNFGSWINIFGNKTENMEMLLIELEYGECWSGGSNGARMKIEGAKQNKSTNVAAWNRSEDECKMLSSIGAQSARSMRMWRRSKEPRPIIWPTGSHASASGDQALAHQQTAAHTMPGGGFHRLLP